MSASTMPQALALAFDGASLWVGSSAGAVLQLENLAPGKVPVMHRYLVAESTRISRLAVAKNQRELALADDSGHIWVLQIEGRSEVALEVDMGVKNLVWLHEGLALADMRRKVRLATRGPEGLWVETHPTQGQPPAGPRWGEKNVGADALAVRPDGSLALLDALAFGIWEPGTLAVKAWHQPIDGMRLVYLDGLIGLNATGTHAFMHWDDFLVFDVASGLQIHEGPVEPDVTCLGLSHDGSSSCIGFVSGAMAMRDHASGRVTPLQVSFFPLAEIVADETGTLWAWRNTEGGFGVVDALGHEVLAEKWATEILFKSQQK